MTIPRHEEAPGRDNHRGPQAGLRNMSILSIVALPKEGTGNRCAFCQIKNEY